MWPTVCAEDHFPQSRLELLLYNRQQKLATRKIGPTSPGSLLSASANIQCLVKLSRMSASLFIYLFEKFLIKFKFFKNCIDSRIPNNLCKYFPQGVGQRLLTLKSEVGLVTCFRRLR